VRKGHVPENLALLRRIAASLIKQDKAREAGVVYPHAAKKLAGTKFTLS